MTSFEDLARRLIEIHLNQVNKRDAHIVPMPGWDDDLWIVDRSSVFKKIDYDRGKIFFWHNHDYGYDVASYILVGSREPAAQIAGFYDKKNNVLFVSLASSNGNRTGFALCLGIVESGTAIMTDSISPGAIKMIKAALAMPGIEVMAVDKKYTLLNFFVGLPKLKDAYRISPDNLEEFLKDGRHSVLVRKKKAL